MREDEMDGQGHRSDQHEFDPTLGGSGRQEGLACSGPWGHEESDTTERLNNDDLVHSQRKKDLILAAYLTTFI